MRGRLVVCGSASLPEPRDSGRSGGEVVEVVDVELRILLLGPGESHHLVMAVLLREDVRKSPVDDLEGALVGLGRQVPVDSIVVLLEEWPSRRWTAWIGAAQWTGVSDGVSDGTRTCDIRHHEAALCQLSHTHHGDKEDQGGLRVPPAGGLPPGGRRGDSRAAREQAVLAPAQRTNAWSISACEAGGLGGDRG